MSGLRVQRGSIRRSFTRTLNELKDELAGNANAESVRMLRKRLNDRFNQLEKIDEEIFTEMRGQDLSQEEMDGEFDAIQEYRDKWNDVNPDELPENDDNRSAATHINDNHRSGTNNDENRSTFSMSNEKSRLKLPKLKLVEFNGNLRDWLRFWSQFKGIHDDEQLSLEEKFQYLIQATVVDSPARRVVGSFPPTGQNYGKAIEHLTSRFGKENVLVEVYVRDLLKLVLTNNDGKQKLELSKLYDELETKLQALESLGVTSDKYAAMLYPLVESSLSEDVLLAWERLRNQRGPINENEDELKQLMKFLRGEVESGVRLRMAKNGIDTDDDEWCSPPKKRRLDVLGPVSTTDLMNKESQANCLFCSENHPTQSCPNAKNLTLKERFAKIRDSSKCFKCLKGNHLARECKASINCHTCGGKHYKVLCKDYKPLREINVFSKYFGVEEIIYQTLIVRPNSHNAQSVRALIDSGSGRSYITVQAAERFGFNAMGMIEMAHTLFGGQVTGVKKHSVYVVDVSNIETGFSMKFKLYEVEKICGHIQPMLKGPWLEELAEQNIHLSDQLETSCPIHLLFGADTASKLYTGRIFETEYGPVAFETKFGWTLMGTVTGSKMVARLGNTILYSHSMFVKAARIQDLWNLDIIGIHDSADVQSKEELAESAVTHFNENVKRFRDGRYEVSLPWIAGHPPVSVNRNIAEQRLRSAMTKLVKLNKVDSYQRIFDEWLDAGIIEEVPTDEYDKEEVSYLPHHPVFNEKSSTTPIRPVFDASSRSKGFPSLNDCLEKGKNLLIGIPSLLIMFRMKQFATISDIKRAFLQISVTERDRDFLRFLWYKDGEIVVLRHTRVVFGISASPFLLGATMNHHLDNIDGEWRESAVLLKKSIYVDNCVTSFDTEGERTKFIAESTDICTLAKFELRGWVWNRGESVVGDVTGVGSPERGLVTGNESSQETSVVSVLGLLWNISDDTLSLDLRRIQSFDDSIVTKKKILAATHQIYDPIGFTSPVVIVPKMLLQAICKKKLKWDEAVPEDIKKKFVAWKNSLSLLSTIKIPRWVGSKFESEKAIHIFTDASKNGYTATAFLRCNMGNDVSVQLILAKSRVSTIKPITIPRLELIACECGAKMAKYLQETLDMTNIELYLWSDSGNALSWIKRNENWQTFVHNRVKTINALTNAEDWRHIPGHLNPADLPSRGCMVKQLVESKWWEGPTWLKEDKEFWPKSTINCDETIVNSEKRITVTSCLVQEMESTRYFHRFSQLRKVIRTIAWIRRWKVYKRHQKPKGRLSTEEENEAERCLWRMVQRESFSKSDNVVKEVKAKRDEFGLWRVETKLLKRDDTEDFRRPILLPKDHIAVQRLIEREHLGMHHCDSQTLRNTIRERFWLIQSRVACRKVANGCKRCIRHTAKHVTVPETSLPSNRVRDATPFEVVGIDLGGHLYLNNGEKAWFVVFTCAVYRAIHLELITSLSTPAFIQALRRFIARRGRPMVIYSDNGTNFVGTVNLMNELDWKEIEVHTEARNIRWIFNPPSAPWWGGWWERIVGLVKLLLRKRLGRNLLDYEEMMTVLCDCEQLLNLRPLTYISEDPDELIPLTPMMFLNEAKGNSVVDLDYIESNGFRKKFQHRQEIRNELRERFRKDYLSLLVQKNIRNSDYKDIKVGDVVIVEMENKKRVDWPIAKVIKIYPGQDKVVRSVKIRVIHNGKISEIDRPIQRLYMLESSLEDAGEMMNHLNRKLQEEALENVRSQLANDSTDKVELRQSAETVNKFNEIMPDNNAGDLSAVDDTDVADTTEEEIRVTRSGRKVMKPRRFE